MDRLEYEGLKQFCNNELQRERLDTYFRLESYRKVADELGCSPTAVKQTMNGLRHKAARKGFSPDEDAAGMAPDGFAVKGKSILRDGDGSVRLVWTKTNVDQARSYELALEAIEALKSEIIPAQPVPQKVHGPPDLLNLFIVTDYHLGMKAWGEETRGDDWDIGIAERLLVDWFTVTIERMHPAETAVFAQLGDFLHWDGLDAVTPTHGHILDADTRFQLLVRVAIRVLRHCTTLLLEKHDRVHLIHAEGNHDLASSVWLRELFSAFYENEPRVTVDTSADPYYALQHGKTGLFFHHGHKRKTGNLDQVLVRKFREIYGSIDHAYAHTGHLHHDKIESNLMVVEQHRTLAAADAHASRGGWMSGRDAKGITYHKEYGEVARATVSPEMVRDLV